MCVALRSAPRPLQPSGALAPDPVCLEDLAGSSRESRGGRHREPLGRVCQLGVGLGRVRSLVPQSGEWSLSVLVFLTVCSRPTAPVRTAETLLPVGSSPASVCLSPWDPFCTVPCPAEGLSFSVSVAGATQADRGQDRAGRLRDSRAVSRTGLLCLLELVPVLLASSLLPHVPRRRPCSRCRVRTREAAAGAAGALWDGACSSVPGLLRAALALSEVGLSKGCTFC